MSLLAHRVRRARGWRQFEPIEPDPLEHSGQRQVAVRYAPRVSQERHPLGGGRRGRAFVRRVANPFVLRLGLAGGRRSLWGVMTAPGRRSGKPRSNPVVPHIVGDAVLIPMSFGPEVQWVRNVLAAGGGTLQYRGRDWRLAEPQLVSFGSAATRLPARLAASYERMRVDVFLELRVEAGW